MTTEKAAFAIWLRLYGSPANGADPVGDLRYLADTKAQQFATPIAEVANGRTGMALVGDKARAWRPVYGAALRRTDAEEG